MPTYFFKFCNGSSIDQDPFGLECPNLDAARKEALQAARELLSDAVRSGSDVFPDCIIIADAKDTSLSVVPIVDALPH